ncbi:mucin-2-like isoform X1 [Sitodiplosis mosellana]|uniref:mucin-2-like isoform X1 n=1 Tax=Sitodiplosis mosellana TaxID=263140 RepID=UPI002444630C|nr:mucin-2-like isoform X1 [Sitodiplosis mosellana]XP_055301561.1 mucin-2-like isoform X1 [Sitodiplosis mosellana]
MASTGLTDYDINNKPDELLNDVKSTVKKATVHLNSSNTSYDINKPNNLLEDVKSTVNKASAHLANVKDRDGGIDSGLLEPSSATKTICTETSTTTDESKPSTRSVLGSPSLVRKVMNESRTRQRSPSPKERDIKFDTVNRSPKASREVKFDSGPLIEITPNSTTTRTYNYSKTTTRNASPYKTEIVEMDTTDLPPELKDVPISNDLLPQPGTKVTTTVKTFSYEIPDDTKTPTNKNFTYKNEFYNSSKSSNTYYPDSDAPIKTSTQLSESRNTSDRTIPPSIGPNQSYYYKKEVNETKNNVYGGSPPPPANMTTSLYERNETNDTRNVFHPPGGTSHQNGNLPPGAKQTYLYKKETTNTTNTVYEPPNQVYVPPEPVTNKYYKSTTSTTTNTHSQPLLTPFPTVGIDGPPKNLNQLMASFDEEMVQVDDEPYVPRKEVNTALATKNVAGPPVYYPPGKELFAKSEAQAALRARGGYGKGSGKYEYEAESKSKNASKSGAAVVPVCLPLCCAMPCSIM